MRLHLEWCMKALSVHLYVFAKALLNEKNVLTFQGLSVRVRMDEGVFFFFIRGQVTALPFSLIGWSISL